LESIVNEFFIIWLWNQLNEDALLGLLVLKNKSSIGSSVVDTINSNTNISKLLGSIVNSDLTIATVLSANLDLNLRFLYGYLNTLGIWEEDLTWLVIINDGDCAFSILSEELVVGLSIVELDKEVLIRLPLIVIKNGNVNSLLVFTSGELNNSINWGVVFVSFGITIDSGNSNSVWLSVFVVNNNLKLIS